MTRRSRTTFVSVLAIPCFSLLSMSCGGDGGGPATCGTLGSYMATVAGPVSFTTDIKPILDNITLPFGCSVAGSCHGAAPVPLDPAMTKTLLLFDTPEVVRMTLLQQVPVNAPAMKFVVPSNVGASFLAYKISSAAELACANSMCANGASVGVSKPCGDPMPVNGALTAAERTKILDWIALGAAM